MSRKVFYAFLLFCLMGALCLVPASAEDYGQEITITSSDVSMNLYGFYNAGSNYSGAFSGSTTYVRSNLRSIQRETGSGWDNAFQCAQTYQQNSSRLPIYDKTFPSVNHGNANTINISEVGFSVDYALPALYGWYTCTYDIYLGVGVGYPRNGTASYCVNSFTVDGSADFYTDSNGHPFIIQYLDTLQSTFSIGNNTQRFDLLHFQAIYQGDHVEETLSLGLYDYIHSHIAGWQASGVYGNGYDIAAYTFQAFVDMHVYYMAEPPATPTPVPTPYPGQDTQESINAGVVQIESQVNQIVDLLNPQATPIPTPVGIEIDETLLDNLESMTLPDISDGQPVWSTLWDVFEPLLPFVLLMGTSLTIVYFVMFLLRGGWL